MNRTNFEYASNLTGWTSNSLKTQVCPPKPNFKKSRNSNMFRQKQAEPRPKSGKTKLQTLANPGSSTEIELRTRPNPPKILNFEPMNWVRPNANTYFESQNFTWLASHILDQTYTVRSLLVIWLSCIDNGSIKEISTPRYLYNDEEGRKCILKQLDKFNHCDKVKKLSFLMYSFYSHSRRKSDEFVLEGMYCFILWHLRSGFFFLY